MTRRPRALALLTLVLGAGACVKSSTHNRTLDLLAQSEGRAANLSQELAATSARLSNELALVEAELERTRQTVSDRDRRVSQLSEDVLTLENDASRLNTLLNQRGAESQVLQRRLETLSALEREIRDRNRIYEDIIGRFRGLIDSGQLSVSITRGRLAINLPQDILFESGSATLGRDGRTTLTQVARVLADIPDRTFQIEGHTDNVPIATARFPSNWELSAARALSVVHLLQEQGVAPERVSGAAFGEYQPVSENEAPAGRRLNRRIEIVMVPNLDVLAGVGPALE
jgi:chemotaxis protein MotB